MSAITSPSPGASHTANPWPALGKAGVLGVNALRDKPLAGALDATTRAGLEDVVERITDAGGTFEVQRNWLQAKVMGSEYAPLPADEVVPFLARKKLPFNGDSLTVNIGGEERLGVYTLEDLRSLDIVYGLGVAAAGTQAPVARALQHLIAQGWSFRTETAFWKEFSGCQGPYPVLATLNRGPWVEVYHTTAGSEQKRRSLQCPEDLVAMAYFDGGAPVDDLAERSLAKGLQDLEDRGYRFSSGKVWRPNRHYDAYEAYKYLTRDDLLVGRPGDVMVPFNEADLADIPGLEQRIQSAGGLYAPLGKPVLEHLDRTNCRQSWVDAVMRDETLPALSREDRAELLGILMKGQVGQPGDPVLRASADLQALLRRIGDPEQLRTEASWLARLRAACGDAGEPSDETLARVRDRLWLECGTPDQYARTRQDLLRLAEATGSIERAREALDFVRVAAGGEAGSDCIAMIERLATSAGVNRGEAVLDLQCVLVHRLENETLDQATSRFCEMRGALSAARQGSRTREFFAIIQEKTRATGEGPDAADQTLQRMVEALPIQPEVDVALDGALHPAGGRTADSQTVKTQEDGFLVVGGIRIPTRDTVPTPGDAAQDQGGEPA